MGERSGTHRFKLELQFGDLIELLWAGILGEESMGSRAAANFSPFVCGGFHRRGNSEEALS